MKRNAFLIACLLILILSFSSTVWGFSTPRYRPDIEREVGNNYSIGVKYPFEHPYRYGVSYRQGDLFKIDLFRTSKSQSHFFTISYCFTPEYQKNSRFFFLRVKQVPPELAAVLDDFGNRKDAFEEEYDVEFIKREPVRGYGIPDGDDSMKPYHDRRKALKEELEQICAEALLQTQQQDWVYYIINKADETVTGPISEQAFLASKAVGGKEIHWNSAPQTLEEHEKRYRNAGFNTGLVIIVIICFPFFLLLLLLFGIIYVIYHFCKKKKKRTCN